MNVRLAMPGDTLMLRTIEPSICTVGKVLCVGTYTLTMTDGRVFELSNIDETVLAPSPDDDGEFRLFINTTISDFTR